MGCSLNISPDSTFNNIAGAWQWQRINVDSGQLWEEAKNDLGLDIKAQSKIESRDPLHGEEWTGNHKDLKLYYIDSFSSPVEIKNNADCQTAMEEQRNRGIDIKFSRPRSIGKKTHKSNPGGLVSKAVVGGQGLMCGTDGGGQKKKKKRTKQVKKRTKQVKKRTIKKKKRTKQRETKRNKKRRS